VRFLVSEVPLYRLTDFEDLHLNPGPDSGLGPKKCCKFTGEYRSTSLIRNRPPPLGLPEGPRHRPTVGSWGGVVLYERGNPVQVDGF